MKKILLLCVLIFEVFLAVALAQDAEPATIPDLADLPAGEWTQITPGGETICSNGTPFWYFVRPADVESDKLMIFFDGGGACWFGEICDLRANPTYAPFADQNAPGEEGIFDFSNELNPVADYHSVFVPYCTADVHIGNTVQTYTVESTDGEVTINHKGYVNAMAVLDWVFENYTEPSTVLVTGSSAGAIPSPFYAEFVTEAYPETRVEVLADGAGGYRLPVDRRQAFEQWGTVDILTELYPEIESPYDLTFETFYINVGRAYPEVSMTQYNTAADQTQLDFLALNGVTETPLLDLLEANYADISAEIENFDAFTAGGDTHTILTTPFVYTYRVGDMSFVDWMAAIVNGEEVDSYLCDDCAEAETIESE